MSNRELKIEHKISTKYSAKLVLHHYDDNELRVIIVASRSDVADIVLNHKETKQLIDFLKIHYEEMMK